MAARLKCPRLEEELSKPSTENHQGRKEETSGEKKGCHTIDGRDDAFQGAAAGRDG